MYGTDGLKRAFAMVQKGVPVRVVASRCHIPRSTIGREFKKFQEEGCSLDDYFNKPKENAHLVLLSKEEEDAVSRYLVWQQDRGLPLYRSQVKALIREIHGTAVASGERRKPINIVNGPSNKFMREFDKRHPEVSMRWGESVDRGRINMASKKTINEYFDLLKQSLIKHGIATTDSDGNITDIASEKVYLADETGWGVQSKRRKVYAAKGAKHVFMRKPSDETHKTLMLGVCGNGDVLKPLVILEKSFPLLGENEAAYIPDNILLSKTENGSMELPLFTDWIKNAVIPHKNTVNKDGTSLLIVDNHSSRFSVATIDLCIANNIEILCYPGHLTHILQGPDVVLNKPINTVVEDMIHNNIFLSGNSDLSRVAFIAIIDHAVKQVCTKDMVMKAFIATGVIPFNPSKIDLSAFPSSSSCPPASESPIKATCSTCRVNDVSSIHWLSRALSARSSLMCSSTRPHRQRSAHAQRSSRPHGLLLRKLFVPRLLNVLCRKEQGRGRCQQHVAHPS